MTMQPDPVTDMAHIRYAATQFVDQTEYQNEQELKEEFGDKFRNNLLKAPFEDAGPFVAKRRELVILYEFRFDQLPADEVVTFNIYYGAASTQSTALNEMQAVGAETYAFGWDLPSDDTHDGAEDGTSSQPEGGAEVFVKVGENNTECAANHDSTTFMIGFTGVKY